MCKCCYPGLQHTAVTKSNYELYNRKTCHIRSTTHSSLYYNLVIIWVILLWLGWHTHTRQVLIQHPASINASYIHVAQKLPHITELSNCQSPQSGKNRQFCNSLQFLRSDEGQRWKVIQHQGKECQKERFKRKLMIEDTQCAVIFTVASCRLNIVQLKLNQCLNTVLNEMCAWCANNSLSRC